MIQLTIQISTLARTDLKNIGRYTAQQWSIEQRNHYLLRFDERFKILSTNPKMGHCCNEIREGYRRFREGEHVIFYTLTEKTLDIIRVLHKNMDIEKHL